MWKHRCSRLCAEILGLVMASNYLSVEIQNHCPPLQNCSNLAAARLLQQVPTALQHSDFLNEREEKSLDTHQFRSLILRWLVNTKLGVRPTTAPQTSLQERFIAIGSCFNAKLRTRPERELESGIREASIQHDTTEVMI